MNARDYITSERFIHDILLGRAYGAVKRLPNLWRSDKRIDSSLFLWPGEPITTDDGQTIHDVTVLELPSDYTEHADLIRSAIKRVKAYAFLLVRNEGKRIRALFESPHGTRAWVYPIKRSADTWVLGKLEVTNNQETLGLLWSPRQGHS